MQNSANLLVKICNVRIIILFEKWCKLAVNFEYGDDIATYIDETGIIHIGLMNFLKGVDGVV